MILYVLLNFEGSFKQRIIALESAVGFAENSDQLRNTANLAAKKAAFLQNARKSPVVLYDF